MSDVGGSKPFNPNDSTNQQPGTEKKKKSPIDFVKQLFDPESYSRRKGGSAPVTTMLGVGLGKESFVGNTKPSSRMDKFVKPVDEAMDKTRDTENRERGKAKRENADDVEELL
jgi:hypothetical protein